MHSACIVYPQYDCNPSVTIDTYSFSLQIFTYSFSMILDSTSSNSAEPTRQESWSEWAWSWLPTWVDRDVGIEEAPLPPTSLPIYFSAYLDDVSLVFKVIFLLKIEWDRIKTLVPCNKVVNIQMIIWSDITYKWKNTSSLTRRSGWVVFELPWYDL